MKAQNKITIIILKKLNIIKYVLFNNIIKDFVNQRYNTHYACNVI